MAIDTWYTDGAPFNAPGAPEGVTVAVKLKISNELTNENQSACGFVVVFWIGDIQVGTVALASAAECIAVKEFEDGSTYALHLATMEVILDTDPVEWSLQERMLYFDRHSLILQFGNGAEIKLQAVTRIE
jgi:hypothetical protein